MIRVLVMANDSVLADSIASILSEEIDLDIVRLTHRELGKGDRYSVVIIVDEDELENETIKVTDLFREEISLLVIKLSLKSRNIFVYESYQLNNPRIERVIHLVRDFGRANLKKKADNVNISDLRKANTVPFQVDVDPLAHELYRRST
jgi:hypothetical protein